MHGIKLNMFCNHYTGFNILNIKTIKKAVKIENYVVAKYIYTCISL